jgi:hypothetical protein
VPIALAIALIALVVGATPAGAASTRAEYVAQVDPMCQAALPQLASTQKAFERKLTAINKRVKSGRFKGILRLITSAARSLNAYTTVHANLTTQISGVPPAPPDVSAVNGWLQNRRNAESFGTSAASSLKHAKFRQFARQLNQAAAADQAGIAQISGFGFQFCAG